MFHRSVGEFEGELVTGMYKIQDLLEPTSKEDVFSMESVLRIRWPKYWRLSFSISPEIRLIMFFAAKDEEALYSQQKQDQELTVA